MELRTKILMTNELITKVNSVALDIAMTISSQAPRSVPTSIVVNNLVKVQSIGSEIGINNLPTSAQQLKHKVIKACTKCDRIELTSKYNFLKSFQRNESLVLCRICSQNTEKEFFRRSALQIEHMKSPDYKQNSLTALIGPKEEYDEKVRIFCEKNNKNPKDFKGFRRELGSRYDYGFEFNRNLKLRIKIRDLFECQICRENEKFLSFALEIHHIDFDKHNNIPQNLVSLCKRCHSSIRSKNQEENIKLKIYAEQYGNILN